MWGSNSMREKPKFVNGLRFAALTIGLGVVAVLTDSAARALTITACVNTKSGAVTFISSGACKKGTTGVVLNPPPATTLTAQKINLVDASNHVRASLGQTADGNVLTFFDSSGAKTLTFGNNAEETAAGATAWDNNKIIPGTGVPRVGWGEVNPNNGSVNGFGMRVFDGNGNTRTGLGMSYDLTENTVYAIDANGTSTGFLISPTGSGIFSSGYAGYFANDANGVNRQFGGISLDGQFSEWDEADPTGQPRLGARQVPPTFIDSGGHPGNGFVLEDGNGQGRAAMGAAVDGSDVGFSILDKNNKPRLLVDYTDQNGSAVDTLDQNGNVTGHLP